MRVEGSGFRVQGAGSRVEGGGHTGSPAETCDQSS